MAKAISIHAVAVDEDIPRDIRQFFDERLAISNVFGTKCYLILEDEENSPLNLLDEEFYRRVKRWLSTVISDKVFSYTWKID
jgi:hypothetical protein